MKHVAQCTWHNWDCYQQTTYNFRVVFLGWQVSWIKFLPTWHMQTNKTPFHKPQHMGAWPLRRLWELIWHVVNTAGLFFQGESFESEFCVKGGKALANGGGLRAMECNISLHKHLPWQKRSSPGFQKTLEDSTCDSCRNRPRCSCACTPSSWWSPAG